MRPYAEKLQEILVNVSASWMRREPLCRRAQTKRVLLVAVTSNRGLCGPFNNNIVKLANQRLKELAGKEVHILCLGKKAATCSAGPSISRRSTWGMSRIPSSTTELRGCGECGVSGDGSLPLRPVRPGGDLYNRFVNAAVQDVM